MLILGTERHSNNLGLLLVHLTTPTWWYSRGDVLPPEVSWKYSGQFFLGCPLRFPYA